MRIKLLVFILLFGCLSAFSSVERNYLSKQYSVEYLSSCLLQAEDWVPYPDYKDRAAWDQLLGSNKALFIQRGEKRISHKWHYIPATAYLEFERSGERFVMQGPNLDNNTALSDLVMAELAEGKGRFIDQIVNGVFMTCERTSWVLSAHLKVQKSGRTLPDHTEHIIDLASAELGAMLSWIYYFLNEEFDQVDPVISKRLKTEIYNKVILPYRNETRYWWMAYGANAGMVNNWNTWCNSSVLQCLLLLEKDKEQLSRDVYKTMVSIDKYINFVHADGACEEGPSYWEHAAGKLYDHLEMLHMASSGKISLYENDMIRNLGEYISNTYVGNNWVVNFADASAKFTANASLIYRYGKSIDSERMKRFAAYLLTEGNPSLTFGVDFFRCLESARYDSELLATKAEHNTPECVIYPETQFYYFNNKNRYFAAIKAGHNGESHNHNDVGTFSLYFKETPVVIDAGVGTYTRQTFGPERYTIWTMRSTYHNLPYINGAEQVFGKQYRASDVKVDKKRKAVSMDIASAYPEESQIRKWERTYRLMDNEFVIEDQFDLKKAEQANEIHFLLWGNIDIQTPGKVSLNVKQEKMKLEYDKEQFTATLETIPLPDTRLSNVWGEQIFLLKLQAKSVSPKGKYRFTIKNDTK